MIAFIPPWVYAILATLLWFGYVQSRPRLVAPKIIASVAAGLSLYSLWGVVSAFGPNVQSLASWATGFVLTISLAQHYVAPRGMSFDQATGRVQVPGSWLPMVLMMSIFCIKFGLGFAAGIGTPVVAGSATAIGASFALGILSGAFLARARAVLALVPRGLVAS
jgi:hypothetical protein